MSPGVLLAQITGTSVSNAFVLASIAALCIAGLTAWNRGAGCGCLGFWLFILAAPNFVGWSVVLRCWGIAGLGFAAVWAYQHHTRQRARRERAAERRAFWATVRIQRRPIPEGAEPLGQAIYQGGIRALNPNLLVDLLVAETTLWLVPDIPVVPAVPLDASRLVKMYVAERSNSVVLVLAGERGRNQEVELAATEKDTSSTARQLYAVLNEALPASARAARPVALRARPCVGCGAGVPGGEERCPYCGRPQ